jgi:hypothetical protein
MDIKYAYLFHCKTIKIYLNFTIWKHSKEFSLPLRQFLKRVYWPTGKHSRPAMVGARVARFFLIKYTKTGYTTPNLPINYPMSINYSKWQKCIPNFYVHKIYQSFLVQGHQKFIQIEIFGQKIYLPFKKTAQNGGVV